MKSVLIVVLILLVIALYFATGPTKKMIGMTGKVSLDVGKKVVNELKNNEDIKNTTKEVIEDIKGEILNKRGKK